MKGKKAYVNGTHACKTHFPQIRAVTAIGVGNFSMSVTITINDSEADSEGMRHFASKKFTFISKIYQVLASL